MFLIKKTVTFFLNPFHAGLVVCLIGLAMLWFFKRRREKQGRVLVTTGVLWMCFFGMDPVAKALMKPLEDSYRPVGPVIVDDANPSPEFIVVLAAGHRADPDHPVSSALKNPALQRLGEGIRLYRQFPGSKLVLSGGVLSYGKKECETMKAMALELGVAEEAILLEGDSKDSKDQAQYLKALLGDRPFLLVTSASHMRRAAALFEGQGMHPVPAPTAFITSQDDPDSFWVPFPNGGSIGNSHRALHEYVGSFWSKLRGQR